MNKSDLVEELARRAGVPQKKAEAAVNTVFGIMADALTRGGRIEIRGFGSFMNKSYKAYMGRNPKTKESIHVPPKRLPFFKVGKELKARVNRTTEAHPTPPGGL